MVEGVIFFQSYGFYGGNIGNILSNLEQLGFFDYLLPFLIIFAIVFGILSKTNIFGDNNKSINAIIAIAVGLMALQFGLVSVFFSELFPRFGIGLSILLVIMIILGLFRSDDEKWQNYVLLGIGAIIVVAILIQSAGGFGFYSGYWWYNNWPSILAIVAVGVGVIIVIANSGRSLDDGGVTVYPGKRR